MVDGVKNRVFSVALVILSMTALPTATVAAQETVTDELARNGAVTCQPTLDHFCRNIHVGCSGRSSIPSFTFDVTISGDRASLKQKTPVESPQGPPPRSGPVSWADGNGYAIVWLRPTPDYLKIVADGSYIFRHYSGGTAYMSYGKCR